MDIEQIKNLLPSLEHLRGGVGYWIGFFAGLLETTLGIGLILPGSTIVLLLGALSARGYFDPVDLIWCASLGAVIGDNINYFLGRRFGTKWLTDMFRFFTAEHVAKGKKFLDAHGGKSVFLGRFIPSGKELIPFIAGSVGMNKKAFLFWNVLGAAGWGVEYVGGGYLFAQSLNIAELWLSRAGLFLAFLLISGGLLYLVKWLVARKGRQFVYAAASIWRSVTEAVATNERVEPWLAKHRRTVTFLKKRFDPAVFMGLPLSLLTLAFFYVLALFGGVIEDLITSDPIVAADIRVANLFSVLRTETLTEVFTWITMLGKFQVVAAFMLAATALLRVWRKKYCILPLFMAVAGSEGFTWLGKLLFHRPRPPLAVYAEPSFSFPSGHATVAVAFYGFAAYLLIRAARSWQTAVNIFFFSLLLIVAIGFSRVYLGEHYISDVWSGYLVGAMWLIIAISFAEWFRHKQVHDDRRPASPLRAARPVSFGLVAAATLFYVIFSLSYHPPAAPAPVKKMTIVPAATDVFGSEQDKFTETVIGEKQEPINFIFLADRDRQLLDALRRAGWTLTHRANISTFIKAVKALMEKRPHPEAPIAPSFWKAKVQDMGFAKVNGANWLRNARHLRIWQTDFKLKTGQRIYVGMADANDGFTWGIIPRVSPDLDSPRERLNRELSGTKLVKSVQKVQLTEPLTGKNFVGDPFFSDGKAYIISLR